MNIIVRYMTKNDCYVANRKITPKGIMVHSTATPDVMAAEWYDRWNKPDILKCVHAFVDDKEAYQYLPWDHRGWHAGGAANNTHIGFEICEPKDLNDKEYFEKAYRNAIKMCVFLCKEFNLTEKDVLCHAEGFKKGMATNHADVLHWFPRHGKNMDTFREDLKEALKPPKVVVAPKPKTWELYIQGDLAKELQHELNDLRIKDKDGNKLVVDGFLGDHTIEAMDKVLIKPYAGNGLVKVIQRRLMQLGFKLPKHGADSVISTGGETEKAVKAFQKSKGLKEDGIIGKNTMRELFKK